MMTEITIASAGLWRNFENIIAQRVLERISCASESRRARSMIPGLYAQVLQPPFARSSLRHTAPMFGLKLKQAIEGAL